MSSQENGQVPGNKLVLTKDDCGILSCLVNGIKIKSEYKEQAYLLLGKIYDCAIGGDEN